MLLLDEMELTKKKLKGTPRPKNFRLRKKVNYKQAVVKLLSSLNRENIDFAMFYIAKNSENYILKDEKGNDVNAVDVLKDWKKNMSSNKKSNEAMHLTFSIDEEKSKLTFEALEESVKEVLKHNFFEYKYVYTIHKHQGKPHVHVIINKRSKLNNKLLHFEKKSDFKKFYKNLRDEFAANLNHYNENFNYKSEYIAEKDLKYKMLKKTTRDLEKKLNLNNKIISQANKNIEVYKQELEDINNRIKINLDEKIELNVSNHQTQLIKVNIILKRNKELTRIKNDLLKNIKKQETLIKNTEFIIKEAATKDFVNVEHTIKFFESKMNKRNMTLGQYLGVIDIKNDFKELKHFYNLKVSSELKNEKDEIQLLSMTTNAFKIYKLYKQVLSRKFENQTVINNIKNETQINKNKKFIEKVFKERSHEVELMIRKTKRTIELLKNGDEKKIQQKEKELSFLKKEQKFIENIKEIIPELNPNFFDINKSMKKFKTSVKNINEKTSVFQLQKIIAEKEYFKEHCKDKEELEYLDKIERDLKKHIDTRALKNYRTKQFLKAKLKDSRTVKEKSETLSTQEFLTKEKELLSKVYDKYLNVNDRKLYLSEFEQSLNEVTKETSIYKIIQHQEELTFRFGTVKSKEEVNYLEELEKDIKKHIDTRAFRNYQMSNLLKEKYRREKGKDQKAKVLESIKFINTEKKTIETLYDKTFDSAAKKTLINEFEKSLHSVDQNKSIYTIKTFDEERKFRIKFNTIDQSDSDKFKTIKEDIKLKVMLREDKVSRSIEYYTNKLIKEKELEEPKVNKINKSLDYLKKENKDIKEFKYSQIKDKYKSTELER